MDHQRGSSYGGAVQEVLSEIQGGGGGGVGVAAGVVVLTYMLVLFLSLLLLLLCKLSLLTLLGPPVGEQMPSFGPSLVIFVLSVSRSFGGSGVLLDRILDNHPTEPCTRSHEGMRKECIWFQRMLQTTSSDLNKRCSNF